MKAGRCGLLVLLLLAGCPSSDQKWSRNKAEGFLKNVFEGNLEAARAYSVDDFKFDNDPATFAALLKGRAWQITTERISPQGDEAYFEGTFDAKPGGGTFLVRVVKQDTKWRVDKFNASTK